MTGVYESYDQPMISRGDFIRRVALQSVIAGALLIIPLIVGIV